MIEDIATFCQKLPGRLSRRSKRIWRHLLGLPANPLQLLPGCRFSTVALPLDYPPSRKPGPRYGVTQPRIPLLTAWFETRIEGYRQFLRDARQLSIDHIATHTTKTQPPNPAWVGGPINALDTFALYAMVARARPRTFVEIGSGMTTCFTRQAIRDFGLSTRLISIDPQPRSEIDSICDQILRAGLETCDLSIFDSLEPNDIVFFDGSHRSFMNSDVTVFFIDVLPRLKPGVIVHLHDIHLPWDYPDMFVDWYWNEQYLLAVYMMNAMSRIEPLLPTRFISFYRRDLSAKLHRSGRNWNQFPLISVKTAQAGTAVAQCGSHTRPPILALLEHCLR